jgi:hypothetical protein
MKASMPATFLIPLLLGAAMLTFVQPVLADVGAECRQEALEYGVPPEQMDSYVDGCVQSRGGYTSAEESQEYVPPQEGGEQAENPQDPLPDETAAAVVEGEHVAQ